jgi:ankyrin repeat protein
MTGLHWACKRGHSDLVKLLLENGADIDAKDMVLFLKK